MRYREFLLEFNADITAQKYGSRLLAAYQKNFSDELDGETDDEKIRDIINGLITVDPTGKKIYMIWLIQRIIDGGIQRSDDFNKATKFLEKFETLKKNGYFKRNPEKTSDIGKFKTLSDLGEFILSVTADDEKSKAQKDREVEDRLIADKDVEILLNSERFKVVIPLTSEAASFYGRNTQWCTTSENGDSFEYYSDRGPLYILLDKPNNRRWQFHFQTAQIMDENDRPVSVRSLPKEFWGEVPAKMFVEDYTMLKHIPERRWKEVNSSVTEDLTMRQFANVVIACPYEEITLSLLRDSDDYTMAYIINDLNYYTTRDIKKVMGLVVSVLKERTPKVTIHGSAVKGNFLNILIYDLKTSNRISQLWEYLTLTSLSIPALLIDNTHFFAKEDKIFYARLLKDNVATSSSRDPNDLPVSDEIKKIVDQLL